MADPSPQDLRRASKIFKALSHPQRLRIVCWLIAQRVTTEKELVERFGMPQSTVNKHLGLLKDCGILAATRDGTRVLVELAGPMARHVMDAVCEWVHPETGERFVGDLSGGLDQPF
jgi:ArsR family transcriptional regulator